MARGLEDNDVSLFIIAAQAGCGGHTTGDAADDDGGGVGGHGWDTPLAKEAAEQAFVGGGGLAWAGAPLACRDGGFYLVNVVAAACPGGLSAGLAGNGTAHRIPLLLGVYPRGYIRMVLNIPLGVYSVKSAFSASGD